MAKFQLIYICEEISVVNVCLWSFEDSRNEDANILYIPGCKPKIVVAVLIVQEI